LTSIVHAISFSDHGEASNPTAQKKSADYADYTDSEEENQEWDCDHMWSLGCKVCEIGEICGLKR